MAPELPAWLIWIPVTSGKPEAAVIHFVDSNWSPSVIVALLLELELFYFSTFRYLRTGRTTMTLVNRHRTSCNCKLKATLRRFTLLVGDSCCYSRRGILGYSPQLINQELNMVLLTLVYLHLHWISHFNRCRSFTPTCWDRQIIHLNSLPRVFVLIS